MSCCLVAEKPKQETEKQTVAPEKKIFFNKVDPTSFLSQYLLGEYISESLEIPVMLMGN